MDAKVIDGKKWAKIHEDVLREKLQQLEIRPKIVSILVGDDPASVLYTQIKQKKAQSLGIDFQPLRFPEDADFEEVAEVIKFLNTDKTVNGIMVQLPLPEGFLNRHYPNELLEIIDPQKDVDGLTGKGPLPAAVEAVLSLLEDEGIDVAGKNIAVVGYSDLIGRPLAKELIKMKGKVTVCDNKTKDLKDKTLQADIIVSATGVPHLIKEDMVKEEAVVIDVGTEKVDGKLMGDVDFDGVFPKASKITPVPGGVGPMTVIALMENVIQLVTSNE